MKDERPIFGSEVCSCGKVHSSSLERLEVGSGAINTVCDVVRNYGAKRAFLLADKNTYAAAGEKVERLLTEGGIEVFSYVMMGETIEPDEYAVGLVMEHFDPRAQIFITAGSGVLNDISKLVSRVAKIPYVIVATAPSMDGYASESSSMVRDGLKVSIPTRCPSVVIGDTDVLAAAPLDMLRSGLGDMLAKYVSIAEWRISNLINGEYYCERVAEYIRGALKACTDNAEGLLLRDKKSVEAVFMGLVACGRAMEYAGVSRPASGVEHYISHVLDMRGLEFGEPISSHGEQCAIGTLMAARIYEKIKKMTPDVSSARSFVEAFDKDAWFSELRSLLGKGAETMIEAEARDGKYDLKKHEGRIRCISELWEKIVSIIEEEIPPSATVERLLLSLGIKTDLSDMGIDRGIIPRVLRATKDIRDKYVLSRLVWDLGLEEALY